MGAGEAGGQELAGNFTPTGISCKQDKSKTRGKEKEGSMKAKVYWVSRHDLSPAQMRAIRDLHGEDVEVVKDPVVFNTLEGLAEYIRQHSEGFVYAVAGAPHYLYAALSGCRFGVFENHPAKRQDGTFGLAAVYHVESRTINRVWVNPDPESDEGEALIPVAR